VANQEKRGGRPSSRSSQASEKKEKSFSSFFIDRSGKGERRGSLFFGRGGKPFSSMEKEGRLISFFPSDKTGQEKKAGLNLLQGSQKKEKRQVRDVIAEILNTKRGGGISIAEREKGEGLAFLPAEEVAAAGRREKAFPLLSN